MSWTVDLKKKKNRVKFLTPQDSPDEFQKNKSNAPNFQRGQLSPPPRSRFHGAGFDVVAGHDPQGPRGPERPVAISMARSILLRHDNHVFEYERPNFAEVFVLDDIAVYSVSLVNPPPYCNKMVEGERRGGGKS